MAFHHPFPRLAQGNPASLNLAYISNFGNQQTVSKQQKNISSVKKIDYSFRSQPRK